VPVSVGGPVLWYATEDVELGGVRVAAGAPVLVDLAAANRDATVSTTPTGSNWRGTAAGATSCSGSARTTAWAGGPRELPIAW
jgi:hypothetical protein